MQVQSCQRTGKSGKSCTGTGRDNDATWWHYSQFDSQSFDSFVGCFIVCPFHLSLFHSSVLSVRVMLYRIYEDMTEENLKNMKFLLNGKLGRRQIEASDVRTHAPCQHIANHCHTHSRVTNNGASTSLFALEWKMSYTRLGAKLLIKFSSLQSAYIMLQLFFSAY